MLFDPRTTFSPLKHRAFALYSTGNGVSLLGTWMQRVGAGWLTWELTHSGTWLGIISAAELLPAVLITPFAGAAADRIDRLKVIRTGQLVMMILTFALFSVAVSGLITIWLLLILNTLIGVVGAFVQPSLLAFVPSLVPRPELGAAVAVNSLLTNLSRFIGPMTAGLVIVTTGISSVFLVNSLSYAAFLFLLARLRLPPAAAPPRAREGFLRQLAEGLRYTASHPGISSLLVLVIALSIGGRSLVELLPGFTGAVFERGAAGLSTLTSALGLGAVTGAFWVSGRQIGKGYFEVALACAIGMAIATMAFCVTPSFWLAAAIMVVFGFCGAAAQICMQTSIQLAVDRAMAGRVLSVYGLIFRSSPALGALLIGAASERLGLPLPMFCGGLLLAAVCVLSFVRRQKITASLEGTGEIRSGPSSG